MEALDFDDPREFRAFADPLLLASEAHNCLMIGVTGTLIDRPHVYEQFHLWCVAEDDTPVAAAAMTPPHNLLLSHDPAPDAMEVLAESLTAGGVTLPGVQGTSPAVEQFAGLWTDRNDVEESLEVELGLHALTAVADLPEVPGSPRIANADDSDLLVAWIEAFLEEADPKADRSNVERAVANRLTLDPSFGGTWLWQLDGEPVSLSGYGGRTPNGIRIGPVYTPPNARGRGFATALVARQSAWLLGQGMEFCFLFTDLANPTSNSIYRKIGYHRLANARRYGFKPSLPAG